MSYRDLEGLPKWPTAEQFRCLCDCGCHSKQAQFDQESILMQKKGKLFGTTTGNPYEQQTTVVGKNECCTPHRFHKRLTMINDHVFYLFCHSRAL